MSINTDDETETLRGLLVSREFLKMLRALVVR